MEDKSYLNKSISSHTRKYKGVEIPDVYSGALDFECSHLIGKKGKAMIAALLGTLVEWYDYSLYGYMSVVLSRHFFPNVNPTISLIQHFLVFALGFLARPLGAYIFGSIGDHYGRKYALRWSIIGIALPTILIGCLPSYNQIGITAIILLCLFRLSQGIFVSAESDGVNIFLYETLSKKHPCLANSFNWMTSSFGIGLAAFVSGIALKSTFPEWTWRLPFFLSGILGLITILYRRNLIESYDYVLFKNKGPGNRSKSYLKVILDNRFAFFINIIVHGSACGMYYFYFVFWNNYLSQILNILPASEACLKASFIILISTILAPVWGIIADRIGIRRAVNLASLFCIGMIAFNGISLHYLNTIPTSIMVATAIAIVCFYIPVLVLFIRLYDIGERYRCMSMGNAVGVVIFSSSTPVIATCFWKYFQNPVAPLFYCALLLLMGFVGACFAKVRTEKL
jgi:MHS family proline/betaine transporter-like MFS transporter